MKRTTVIAIGVIALIAAIAAGVVPAMVTGGGSEQPTVSPVTADPGDDGNDPGDGGTVQPAPPGDSGGVATPVVFGELEPFSSCEAFLEHAQGRAIELVGPWGLPQYGAVIGGFAVDDVAVAEAAPAPALAEAPAEPAPALPPAAAEEVARAADTAGADGGGFSGTNVQEVGIDEPDIVKTDGKLMFVVAQGRLYALDATSVEPKVLDSIALAGWDQRLLLAGDRVLVLSQGDPYALPYDLAATEEILPPAWPQTTITMIDASDPGALHELETLTVEGIFLSARQTGPSVRVVISSVPTGLDFTAPQRDGMIDEIIATTRNRNAIGSTTIEDWLPGFVHQDQASGEMTTGLADCAGVRRPETFSGLGMLTVLTLDLESGVQPVDTDSVMTDGQLVYASATGLYVATQQWLDWEEISRTGRGPERIETVIHKFATDEPNRTDYRASGTVAGSLLNQFAMSEHEGYLRVASTEEPAWWGGGSTSDSQSFVTVLTEDGDELRKIGRVGGLGRGERIFAVRFVGDVGYVVTFRQTDPLYTVDLSDPTDPRVRGELKILGYSAYLHPVGDGLVLGVGQDADRGGQIRGTQISLFDVSDLDDPRRLHAEGLGHGTSSEVEYDHHAFLWWPARDLAVLPVQGLGFDPTLDYETWTSAALGTEVSRDRGIEPVGAVTHPDGALIRRSLVIGDTLFTVSELGVMANELATWNELGWAPLS